MEIQFSQVILGIKDDDRIALIMERPHETGVAHIVIQVPVTTRIPQFVEVLDISQLSDEKRKEFYQGFPHLINGNCFDQENWDWIYDEAGRPICWNKEEIIQRYAREGIPLKRGNNVVT